MLEVAQQSTNNTQFLQVCKTWNRVAYDELLWKDIFYSYWKVPTTVTMAHGKCSWLSEFKRLCLLVLVGLKIFGITVTAIFVHPIFRATTVSTSLTRGRF